VIRPGRHDPQQRRKATRGGRQKGCYVYIAAEQLERGGYDPSGPAPWYTISGGERGRYVVTLYTEA